MRSLGLLPMATSKGVLPLRVTCVFLTVAALRINWAVVICDRVVWSKIVGCCIRECREKLLEQSYTHLGSTWPWSVRSCRKSLHIVHSIECLRVMRMMEGQICTSRLRVRLESVHPLMKLSNDFRWRGTLARICCQNVMWLHSKRTEIQRFLSPIFVDPWSKKKGFPNSSALKSAHA